MQEYVIVYLDKEYHQEGGLIMNSPFKLVIHVLHGVIALEFYLPKIKPF